MKNITLFLLLFASQLNAQLYLKGATLDISSGATVYANSEVQNTNSSVVFNEGKLSVTQNLTNNSGCGIEGNGTYNVQGNWVNDGVFTPQKSTLILSGNLNSSVTSGGNAFHKVTLNKSHGKTVTLSDDMTVISELEFAADNNKILIGTSDLTLGDTASIVSFDENEYVVTGGTGVLRKNLLPLSFTYPVGFDTISYNPVILSENGINDSIGVRCTEHPLTNGSSGAPISEKAVDASWEITENSVGGSDLTVTFQWNSADELPDFDRNYCGIARYGTQGWDLTIANAGAASGTNPFYTTRLNIDSVGIFAVGNEPVAQKVKLGIDLLMEGAYSGSGLMTDDLRNGSLIPLNEPYSGLGFTHEAFGGGEFVTSGVLSVTGDDAITDWVLVEIRDSNNHSDILATKSALIQKDGDITDLDGTSDLEISGIGSGNYHVSIRHRNHLGVMSANPISLSSVVTNYDFTANVSNAYGGSNGINNLSGGYFGLFSGDFDKNGQVQNTDVNSLIPTLGNSGYLPGDLNMNGQVQNTDLQLKLYPNLGRGQQF